MKIKGLILIIIALFFSHPFKAQAQNAPSFDCAKAKSRIENTICASPSLSKQDALLNEFYQTSRISAFGKGASNTLSGQISWLKDRKYCENDKKIIECLSKSYDDRMMDLAIETMFVNPVKSFAIIDKYGGAPFYHAIYEYITRPGGAARDRIISDITRTAFNQAGQNNDYIKSVFADEGIKTQADAFKSDKNFGLYLALISTGFEDAGKIVPCAALLKRPGLSSALDSYFGSSIDGSLPVSDCGAVLPPLPKFDTAETLAYKATPQCDGTIIHGIVHRQARDSDLIRIGELSQYEISENNNPQEIAKDSFIIKNAAAIAAAEQELFDYYQKYMPEKNIKRADLHRILLDHLYDIIQPC